MLFPKINSVQNIQAISLDVGIRRVARRLSHVKLNPSAAQAVSEMGRSLTKFNDDWGLRVMPSYPALSRLIDDGYKAITDVRIYNEHLEVLLDCMEFYSELTGDNHTWDALVPVLELTRDRVELVFPTTGVFDWFDQFEIDNEDMHDWRMCSKYIATFTRFETAGWLQDNGVNGSLEFLHRANEFYAIQ